MKLFIEKIGEICDVDHIIVRVAPDNYASQRLVDKLGGIPDGICSSDMFIDDELKTKFEEDPLDLIDAKMIELAKKFNVEPRKLFSHLSPSKNLPILIKI